ncbi:MAG: ABC-type transport auxiliary lipoprotein family protein [Robiginitomaculum sp.]
MINLNTVLRTTVMACVTFGLTGCVSLLNKTKVAPTVYRLNVPHVVKLVPLSPAKVINIEIPATSKALRGTDIVLSPDGRRLSAAGGASWSEPVPSLLRNVLIDTLASRSNLTGVIPKGSTRVPYRLNMNIRRFEAVFDQGEDVAPNAIVQLNLTLTNTKTRRLIGVHTIQASQRASAKSVSSIVSAHDTATGEAMKKVVDWLELQLSSGRS